MSEKQQGLKVDLESQQPSSTESPVELESTGLKRGLKTRHIQLIALAGAIGTGLFVGSGAALSQCGPCPLLLGYIILSVFIWFIMNNLAEMVTYLPIPGRATPYSLCLRYTGNPSLAFAAGINLVYAQSMITPAEISASAFVIQYWNSSLNVAIFVTIFWVAILALNMCAVKIYGETEFWIALIKIITLTGLIILGVVLFFGGGPAQHGVMGFHYWKYPGAFVEHLRGGNTGRFLAVLTSIIRSAFSFILSPELVCCCAAEAKDPRINLPKAANRFIYRLAFFYIGGALVIGIIVGSNDSRLMSAISNGSQGAAASPFVIGIQNAGIKVLNHIVNAVILTSAFSCGNSLLYSATRNLHSLAVVGAVPHFFSKCNRFGVPYYSVALCSAIALLAFLTVSNSATVAFTWLSNIATTSGFVSWIIISITYLRFRKAITHHAYDSRVTYRPILQKVGAWSSITFFTIILFLNGYAVFFDFNVSDFFAAYVTILLIVVMYLGHAIVTRNWRMFAPPEEIDVVTGLMRVEEEEAKYVAPVARNFIEKIWFWIA